MKDALICGTGCVGFSVIYYNKLVLCTSIRKDGVTILHILSNGE